MSVWIHESANHTASIDTLVLAMVYTSHRQVNVWHAEYTKSLELFAKQV
jgi:hypothetical protein